LSYNLGMSEWSRKTIGKVRIEKLLGRGGTAEVYLGWHLTLERPVAVKVLHSYIEEEPLLLDRFQREARVVAGLRHSNIVQIFDFDTADGHPYIVMEYLKGPTLAAYLRNLHHRKKRLPVDQVARVLNELSTALDYAHRHSVIHRDIKPGNIMLHSNTEDIPLDGPLTGDVEVVITDFGLVRIMNATNQTTAGNVSGTPAYMSPEQARGDPTDHRTDIYSLSVVLYEMVAGHLPFEGDSTLVVLHQQIHTPPPPIPGVSPRVQKVMDRALQKNPDDRYQTARELAIDYYRALGLTRQHELHRELDPAGGRVAAEPPVEAPVSRQPEPALAEPEPPPTPETGQEPRPEREPSQMPEPKPVRGRSRLPILLFSAIGIAVLGAAAYFFFSRERNLTQSTATVAPTVALTETPVLASPPTSAPASTAPNPSFLAGEFRDDFDGQLAQGWTLLAEDPSRWSLTEVPGWLQILASDASFDGPSFPTNVLLRDAPAGDFEVTTSLRFAPTSNFQVAGLVVFQDKANVLQYGRGFCDLPDLCSGAGIYFDNIENGSITGSSPRISLDAPLVFLRLRRVGTTYTASYSTDGVNWTLLGEHVRTFSQARVGLIAAQAAEQIPAEFDHFILKSLTE
jgi:serine/threonine-protein kinase